MVSFLPEVYKDLETGVAHRTQDFFTRTTWIANVVFDEVPEAKDPMIAYHSLVNR